MAKLGRKSKAQELQIVQYMAELQPKVFAVLQEHLNSKVKGDRRWASEQMMKLYGKAVPQQTDLTSAGKPIVFVPHEIIEKYDLNAVPSSAEPNSQGQPPV
jgi:hypothetical protein